VTSTDALIDGLVAGAQPVRRMRTPFVRAASYLALTAAVIAALVAWQGVRFDLLVRLAQPGFSLSLGGAIATGILAAWSAAALSVPGRSRLWLLLPLPTLAIWLASVGQGCLINWITLGDGQVQRAEVIDCTLSLMLAALPLTAAMLALLRRAAPIPLGPATLAGGLAAAGLTSAAMTLLHQHDASVMVLIWNVGTLALVVMLQLVLAYAIPPRAR